MPYGHRRHLGRMLFAFGRDGLGPKALAHIHPATGGPRRATLACRRPGGSRQRRVLADGMAGGRHRQPGDRHHFLFAVAGSVCLMVCYLLVEIAAMWFVGAPRFMAVHGGAGRTTGLFLPGAGAVVIVAVLWFSVKDSTVWSAPPILGLFWCAIGFAHRRRRLGDRQTGRSGTGRRGRTTGRQRPDGGSVEVVEACQHSGFGVIGVVAVHRPVAGVVGEDGDLDRLTGQHDDGVFARPPACRPG